MFKMLNKESISDRLDILIELIVFTSVQNDRSAFISDLKNTINNTNSDTLKFKIFDDEKEYKKSYLENIIVVLELVISY